MPLNSPAEIVSATDDHIAETQGLRKRFDDDWSLYRLDEFAWPEEQSEGEDGDYRTYTSNWPRVVANKVMAWTAGADMVLRLPHDQAAEGQRHVDNTMERWVRGVFNSADERLQAQLSPVLRDVATFFIFVRGWYFARCFLRKASDGSTYVDITPWDPLHVAWGMGEDGLDWACYRIKRTKREILNTYGRSPNTNRLRPSVTGALSQFTDEEAVDIYDYYDARDNTLVLGNNVALKPRTPHGSPRFPVAYGFVGTTPMIQTDASDDTMKDVGESLYTGLRGIIDEVNEMMSTRYELAHRAIAPATGVPSADGTVGLDENIHAANRTVSYRSQDGPPHTIEGLKTTEDFDPLVSFMVGELQRGTLPFTAFGELGFTLSGFAINQLSQGIQDVLTPRLKALRSMYRQCVWILSSQYKTRAFEALRLSGVDSQNQYFDEEFPSESLERLGRLDIEFVANLPQDDQTRIATAQMMREGPNGVPLMPDRWIRDTHMGIEDADGMDAEIMSQMAARSLPEAQLYLQMVSAAERGDQQLAELILGQLYYLYQVKIRQFAAMGIPPPGVSPNGGQPTNGAGPTASPQAAPNAMMGVRPVPPGPEVQAGPAMRGGAPRPGAQNDQQRLRSLGLVGP